MIRVLLTGARGQVGSELARRLAGRADVVAHDRASLDLAKPHEIAERVRSARPHVIVNAAAYTAVDRAESDFEAARAVNAQGPAVLADEARRASALLVHFSTDYVFDGAKPSPYVESDAPDPLNAYGRTKLEGERAIAASGCAHLVLRTSWVYGPHGANFLLTMLRLAGRDELRVVDDQHGAPTSSLQLARATVELLAGGPGGELSSASVERALERGGLYHMTASGHTTWFGFAEAIFAGMAARRALAHVPRLVAIPTSEYPTPARRPANSVLSCEKLRAAFGLRLGSWEEGLEEVFSALAV